MMPLRLTMPISVMNPTQWATDSVVAAAQTRGHCHHGAACSASPARPVDDQQRDHRADRRQRDVDQQHLQRRPPRLQALPQQQEHADDGQRAQHQQPAVGLLLGLELAAVLDAVAAAAACAARSTGASAAWMSATTLARSRPCDVARDDDPPLDVLAVERVRPGRRRSTSATWPSATLRPDGVSRIVWR